MGRTMLYLPQTERRGGLKSHAKIRWQKKACALEKSAVRLGRECDWTRGIKRGGENRGEKTKG